MLCFFLGTTITLCQRDFLSRMIWEVELFGKQTGNDVQLKLHLIIPPVESAGNPLVHLFSPVNQCPPNRKLQPRHIIHSISALYLMGFLLEVLCLLTIFASEFNCVAFRKNKNVNYHALYACSRL